MNNPDYLALQFDHSLGRARSATANSSPILKLFLSRLDRLVAQPAQAMHEEKR